MYRTWIARALIAASVLSVLWWWPAPDDATNNRPRPTARRMQGG
jgi:hypothetical protein